MTENTSIIEGQSAPEAVASLEETFRQRLGNSKNSVNTVWVAFSSVVQGSQQEWALEVKGEIVAAAKTQRLVRKDRGVDVTVDGVNLHIELKRVQKSGEYLVSIAAPSLPALDRLLIARREQYRQANTPEGEDYTPSTQSALNMQAIPLIMAKEERGRG